MQISLVFHFVRASFYTCMYIFVAPFHSYFCRFVWHSPLLQRFRSLLWFLLSVECVGWPHSQFTCLCCRRFVDYSLLIIIAFISLHALTLPVVFTASLRTRTPLTPLSLLYFSLLHFVLCRARFYSCFYCCCCRCCCCWHLPCVNYSC